MAQAPQIELSDAEIESHLEALPETEAFIESLEAACIKNVAALPTLGGNILISIVDVGCWTLVTQGPRMGMYMGATDDEIDFALQCEEWVLHELLDPECDVDLESYVEAGVFAFDGDYNVLGRLLQLAQGGGGMIALRAGR